MYIYFLVQVLLYNKWDTKGRAFSTLVKSSMFAYTSNYKRLVL